MAHGPLMVGGFLGTVIGLERAVALGKPWPYAAPLLTGIGAILLMGGWGGPAGALLITLGSGVLVMALIVILRIHVGLDSHHHCPGRGDLAGGESALVGRAWRCPRWSCGGRPSSSSPSPGSGWN